MNLSDVVGDYLPPTDKQRDDIWKQAVFCFDSNVLLNVYRYTDVARAKFLRVLSALKGRLVVPHRVAVELARNREAVIRNRYALHAQVKKDLEETLTAIKQNAKNPDCEALVKIVADAKKAIGDRFEASEKKHLKLLKDDPILPELTARLPSNVGDAYPFDDAEAEYQRRKQHGIPPYCAKDDRKDDEGARKGDVVLWLELLKMCEDTGKPIIFVTDDNKANWWLRSGGDHVPQPMLVREVRDRLKVGVLFYTADRFMEQVGTRLALDDLKGLAEETKEIEEAFRQIQAQKQRLENRRWLMAPIIVQRNDYNYLRSGHAQVLPLPPSGEFTVQPGTPPPDWGASSINPAARQTYSGDEEHVTPEIMEQWDRMRREREQAEASPPPTASHVPPPDLTSD